VSPIIARAPSAEDEDQSNRFRTYLNYLNTLNRDIRDRYRSPSVAVAEICHADAFKRIQRSHAPTDTIHRLLRNAWLTEVQMLLGAGDQSLVPYTNHWTPVQMYYAVYLNLRAFFEAAGMTVGTHHATTLRAIAGEIKSRPALFPYPWKLLCVGAGGGQCSYLHRPPGISIDRVSSLRVDAPVWDSIGMLLRTTRDRQIERAAEDWKRKQRKKRIPASTKRALAVSLPPTSLFDAMYRLRIRSNYEDADAFLTALPSQAEALAFSKAVRRLCWYSMLVLETIIAKYIGRAAFGQCVSNFSARDVARHSESLVKRRWRDIAAHLP
jgi:hypothetical protein